MGELEEAITLSAAEYRRRYRTPLDGWHLMVPWWAIQRQGGWESFCAYFIDFHSRLVQAGPRIIGFETVDPATDMVRRFTVEGAGWKAS